MTAASQKANGAGKRRGAGGRGQDRPAGPILYNFRRPDKFSKDHIRSIQSIQDTFCRFTTNFLASKLRAAVHVELSQQEQSTFGEYIDQLPSPTVMFVSELDPLSGNVVLQLDRTLALMLVDRLLGGAGVARTDRGTAAVTEIEMLLLEDLGKGLFAEFVNAWEQVTPLRATRCEVALSPQQVQGVLPTEVALVIRHDIRMASYKGKLSICLPASTIEPLMPRLNARLLFANPRTSGGAETQENLAAQLESAPLTVRAEIGRATVRVEDLFALEVGDVIRLDTTARSPLLVRVEDRARYLAQPGQRAGQLAVRIIAATDDDGMDLMGEGGPLRG